MCGFGSKLCWEGPLLSEVNKVQTITARNAPSKIHRAPGLLPLAGPKHGTRVLSWTPLCCPHWLLHNRERDRRQTLQHLLKRGRWRGEECVGCLYLPLRRFPAGVQSQQLQNQIPTHPPTPECLTPLAKGNRALSKCGSGVQGDFRRPEDVFSHFCTFLELL